MQGIIFVATHKNYWMPQNSMYKPIQVGCLNKEKLFEIGDDKGDNISCKNESFCELTALYWIWKNIKSDYVGLVHYRRYFDFKDTSYFLRERRISVAQIEEVEKFIGIEKLQKHIDEYDFILPKPGYAKEGVEKEYRKSHIDHDMDILKTIIVRLYPDYEKSMKKVLSGHKIYYCNMFFCKWDLFDEYMQWLFKILFEVERHITLSKDPYQRRVFGFMAERLFNIYLFHNNYRIKELPIIYIDEKESGTKRVSLRSLKKYIKLSNWY